jgi:hypothetical protein
MVVIRSKELGKKLFKLFRALLPDDDPENLINDDDIRQPQQDEWLDAFGLKGWNGLRVENQDDGNQAHQTEQRPREPRLERQPRDGSLLVAGGHGLRHTENVLSSKLVDATTWPRERSPA